MEIVRSFFSRNGIPEHIQSDNGTQFVSEEFKKFTRENDVRNITSALYHPATNGLAESYVQTFKQVLRTVKEMNGTVQLKLKRYLLVYRNTAHATTSDTRISNDWEEPQSSV